MNLNLEAIKQQLNDFTNLHFKSSDLGKVALKEEDSGEAVEIQLPYPCALVAKDLKANIAANVQINPDKIDVISKIEAYQGANDVKDMNNIKNIIAVASGKGGVGKSTTAVNIALALQREGANVGILDADIYGPNLGLMLGVPEGKRPEVVDQKYLVPMDALGLQSMSMSYVTTEDTPIVWRGPKASGAFQQLLGTTIWNDLDYLIVDMPPGTGDIQLTLSQSMPVTAAIIVSTPQDMATQDARKGIAMFNKVNVPVLGVVENMSVHVCTNCGHEEPIFGVGGAEELAKEFSIPFLGALPLDKSIRQDTDLGRPIVAADPEGEIGIMYRDIALTMAAQLAKSIPIKKKVGINVVQA